MRCDNFYHMLTEHLDGRLVEDQARAMEAHAAECAACRREMSLFAATAGLLGRYPEVEPDPEFPQAVRRKLQARKRRGVSRWIGPLAAAAAAILLFWIIGSEPRSGVRQERAAESALQALSPQDRELFIELAQDETWELVEHADVIRALELLDREEPAPGNGEAH
ncbi:MAG: zf-HC2 domain-containing protein [Planctomycetes bacterium]|nr:zf-HC2 domain-containing protein [Planctomycetota bacterium]